MQPDRQASSEAFAALMLMPTLFHGWALDDASLSLTVTLRARYFREIELDENKSLTAIALAHPMASRVLLRRGMDFEGDDTLAQACDKESLELQRVVSEIEIATTPRASGDGDWADAGTAAIIKHILAVFHEPLPEDLRQTVAMAEKLKQTDGAEEPKLKELVSTLRRLTGELTDHMAKEEQVLFPWMLEGREPSPAGPVFVMRQEHDDALEALASIRSLTNTFTASEAASTLRKTLYARLKRLDEDMQAHIEIENEILFPRA